MKMIIIIAIALIMTLVIMTMKTTVTFPTNIHTDLSKFQSGTMLFVTALLSLSTLCAATEDKPEAAMLRQFGPYGRSPDFQRNSRNDRRRPNDDYKLDDLYANHNFEKGDFDRFGDLGHGGQDFGDHYFGNDEGFPSGGSYRQQDNGVRSGGSFERISRPGLNRRAGYTDALDYGRRGIERSGGSRSVFIY